MSMDQTPEETPKNTEATRGEHPKGLIPETFTKYTDHGVQVLKGRDDEQEAAGQHTSTETKPQKWMSYEEATFWKAWYAHKEAQIFRYGPHHLWAEDKKESILKAIQKEDDEWTIEHGGTIARQGRIISPDKATHQVSSEQVQPIIINKLVNLQEKKRMEDFLKIKNNG